MESRPQVSRGELFRAAVIFQLKLVADGLRDAVLIPVSMIAALADLLRPGVRGDEHFRGVLDLGRQTERWINLFGHHEPVHPRHGAGSIDTLIDRVETVVREQYREGGTSESARAAIERALQALRRKADSKGDQ